MVHYETEWQFDAPDLAALRGVLESRRELGGFQLRRGVTRDLTDCYLDTADMGIAHAGYALRLRSDGAGCEATLKSLRSAAEGPKVREEISQAIDQSSVAALLAANGPVSERTRGIVGNQALELLLEVRTRRDSFQVMDGESEAAEIDLDDTRFGDANDAAQHLQRVEVELHAASVMALQPLLAQLRDLAALEPASRSKLEAGLAARGAMPATVVGQMLLQQQLAAWRDLEPAVRLGEDPEALHQLRVTGRRMIASLRILQAASLGGAIGLRRRLQSLLRRMSLARDLDVQRIELEEVGRSLPGQELMPAVRRLQALRDIRQRQLLHLLDSQRVRRLFGALHALSARTPARRRQQSMGELAPDLLCQRYRKVRRRARLAIAQGTVESCHQLRLETKKLRYVAEPLRDLYGEPLRRFLRRLQQLQALLGRVNDSHHAILTLEQLAQRRPRLPVAALFAMGRMAERQQRQLDDSRAALRNAWRRVRGRAWRQLKKTMQDGSLGRPLAPVPAGQD